MMVPPDAASHAGGRGAAARCRRATAARDARGLDHESASGTRNTLQLYVSECGFELWSE